MADITLVHTLGTTVPTPPTGKTALFFDENGEPKIKDETGAISDVAEVPLADATPEPVGATGVIGVSTDAAREDHVHAHGNQAGGSLHADVIAAGASGFMSGTDKTKLNGISASAAALTAVAPVDVTKAAAAVGVATVAARGDHKHDVSTAAPSDLGTANSEGTATSLARSDHVHNHANQAGGSLHATVIAAGAAGFMSGTDKTKLDGIASSAAALTSSAPADVTKAAAVVGVGTTAARSDHKHDISTAATGTISVGDAAAEGSATSLARSDHTHALTAPAAPANVTKAAASAGAASTVARSDHKHDITTAVVGGIAVGDAAAEGTATSLARSDHVHSLTAPSAPADVTKAAASAGAASTVARSDHKHDVSTAAPGAIAIGDSTTEGTATSLARSDHKHTLTAPAAPADVTKATASAGAATTVARSDHKHDISTAVVGTISVGDAAAEGSATSLARSDHTHALTAPAAPVNVTKAAASAGVATTVARSDHKHDITTAAVSTIGTANTEGSATSLARSDHTHDHGAQTSGTLHAAATTSVAGFMSALDKLKLSNYLVSVTDFGATDDDVQGGSHTNNATAIQNAINAVQTAGGGIVYFPRTNTGRYGIDSGLTVTGNNVWLLGDGAVYTADVGSYSTLGGSMLVWRGGATGPMLTAQPPLTVGAAQTALLGFKITDMTFEGWNETSNACTVGLLLKSAHGWFIQNTFWMDFSTTAIDLNVHPETTVAVGSNGQALPFSSITLNVADTTGFPSPSGTAVVTNSIGSIFTFTYTGLSGTTFTGATSVGGSGSLATGGRVRTIGEAHDVTRGYFGRSCIRQLDGAGGGAFGIRLNGSQFANACCNQFETIQIMHSGSGGNCGIELLNSDSNTFINVYVNRASGTNVGMRLNGSATAATLVARNNTFYNCSAGLGGLTSKNNTFPALDNYFHDYQVGNGEPVPTIEAGSLLYFNTNGTQNGGSNSTLLGNIPSMSLSTNFSTTLATAVNTNLAFPIAANEVWLLQANLTVTSGAAGYKLAIAGPAGSAAEGWFIGNGATTPTILKLRIVINTLSTAIQAAAITGDCRVWCRVKNGATAGTVTLQGSSITAGQTTIIVLGSSLQAQKVSEV